VTHIIAIYFKIYPKMTDMDGIKNGQTGTALTERFVKMSVIFMFVS
jgi:hypothetical protein